MSKWLDHSSIIGKIGGFGDKYLNPISWITGGKSTDLTSTVLPEKVNSGLSTVMKPFDKVDKTVNPVRRIPIVNRVGDIVANKPGDALALAAGAVFGGGAALGGGAGGAAGGGAEGGLVAGGGDTAMGGAAGTLGAADSAGASSALGLTAGDVGGAAAGGGTAMGGAAGTLGAADSSAASSQLGLTAGDVSPAQQVAFNGAQDSQLANVQNNLQPVTTDDTLNSGSGSTQQQYHQQQQRRRQQQTSPVSPISGLSEAQYQALVNQATGQIAQSSKGVKTRGATQAALRRGLAGAHPVDTNGVHIAAIQELNKQIDDLGTQIAAAKARRAAKGAPA